MTSKNIVFQTAVDTYTSQAQIGEGGSGRVFRVKDSAGNLAAIKLIDHRKLSAEKGRRFKNELFFCLRNQHENILTISDYGAISLDGYDHSFYVMPLFAGTLRTLLGKSIPHERVLPLFSQIIAGVEAAHLLKVIHRDLKPENILYDSGNDRLVVADFGIARFTEDELITIVQTQPGTRLANFQYAAPEQRCKGAAIDIRADIYALGLILCEMVTGEIAQGTNFKKISGVAPNLAYLDDVVDQMLRQAPGDRPNSIREIKSTLGARGNEFIVQQKLDSLRKVVVPATDIVDPLVLDPVRPQSVDVQRDRLVFTLSKPVTPEWAAVFTNISGVQFYPGHGPRDYGISGNQATVSLGHEGQAQQLVNMFKEYVQVTNRDYEQHLRRKQALAEREAREKMQAKLNEEEWRQKVLKSITL